MSKQKKAETFEEQLQTLELLVEKLESGELSLDEAMQSFEQGIAVARSCQKALAEAEQRVQILTRQGDELLSEPFDVDEPQE